MQLCIKIALQFKGVQTTGYCFVSTMRLFSIIGPKTGLLTFPKFMEFLKISMVKEHWNVFSYFPA